MADYTDSILGELPAGLISPPPTLSLQGGPGFPSLGDLHFRPLRPSDFLPLKLLHTQLFPVDYDDSFFRRAVNSEEGISSWAAVLQGPVAPQQLTSLRHFGGSAALNGCNGGAGHATAQQQQQYHYQQLTPPQQPQHTQHPQQERLEAGGEQQLVGEQLAGFITAKPFPMAKVDPKDRALLGFGDHPRWDQEQALYILTLGVAEGLRNRGVASRLVELVVRGAAACACRCVYLHVISYNTSAITFYRRLGFRELALLPEFYVIRTGRQANPHRELYDAVLFAYPLLPPDMTFCIPMCLPDPVRPAHSPPHEAGPDGAEGEDSDSRGGGGVLRAVSTLASLVPLAVSCGPLSPSRSSWSRPHSPRSPVAAAATHSSNTGSSEGGCSDGSDGGSAGRASSSLSALGGRGGWSSEVGGLVHHRAGAVGFGAGEGLVEDAVQEKQGQTGRGPPDWLRGLFARR